MPKLVFTGKNWEGRVHELAEDKTSVGRGRSNGLVISDPSISEHQCDILVFGREVIVRETGSKNGTFVDGTRVQGQLPVRSGQVLRFGAVEARLEFAATESFPDGNSDSDWTAVHAFAKYKNSPPPAPKPGQHVVAPTSGTQEIDQTLAIPESSRITAPASAEAPRPQVEAKACSCRWMWWVAVAGVAIGAVWLLFLRR